MNTPLRLERLFFEQAAMTPGAAAILFQGQMVSYGELQALVEGLSHQLSLYGVRPGTLVGTSLQRTPMMVAVVLAILRAGGAYLPLDSRYPAERTSFVLSDSGAALLIHDREPEGATGFGGMVLELVDGRLAPIRHTVGEPERGANLPADLAYVIYTSGSTGAPKGVMLGHEATHLVSWAGAAFSAAERSRIAATTSLCFDPSIFELFVPLCTGGALVLKADALERFHADERPTMLNSVPSVLAELHRANVIPNSVRVLNVGGEPLRGDLARAVYQDRPELAMYNHYGPTEATTCASVGRVPRDLTGEPTIGLPVRGAEIVLLDEEGNAVAEGATGEIHIAGPGLALGYLNRPHLNATKFIGEGRDRLYRTGDLGCWSAGELRFAGRVDRQVKVRGFRVELGDVEAALLRVPHVENSHAATLEVRGRSQLVAYVQSQQPLAPEAVREALAAWLPDYMLPAHILVLTAFPLQVSGKIDAGALPQPDEEPAVAAQREVTRMEAPIIHVFEEVLGRTVGPDDSFFDLGGDSLSSVHAALRLEEMVGYELPAALIHQASTPRALARALEHGRPREDGHVSLLRLGGDAPPVFCMADLFGTAFNYLSLASRLGGGRSVYGVVPGPLQRAFVEEGDLSRLTRSFAAELRRIQPQGPYLLAGQSAGGVLAVDLAAALERDGETVRLILLDAYLHARRPSASAIGVWLLREARRVVRPRKPPRRFGLGGALRTHLMRGSLPAAPPNWIPRSQVGYAARMLKTGVRYEPPRFAGDTLLVKAAERTPSDQLFDGDGLLGWSDALTGPVVEAVVAGGHYEFMREPLVAETAAVVTQFLMAFEPGQH